MKFKYFLLLIHTLVKADGEALYSSIISTTPSAVSSKNTKMELLIQPKTDMPEGSMVELLLPTFEEVSFTPEVISSKPVCTMIGVSTPKSIDCTVTALGI